MWHVDKISLSQQHDPSQVPDFGDGSVFAVSAEGELEWETGRSVQTEGSWGTSARVRCRDGRVDLSFNPSRWGRLDNVFGLDLLGALSVANGLLQDLDLPPFSSTLVRPSQGRSVTERGTTALLFEHGAVCTHLDVTQNFAAGSQWRAALARMGAGVWHGKRGREYSSGWNWGSAQHTLLKWYAKGPELRAHKVPAATDPDGSGQQYRDDLASWCEDVGLLRFEVALGRNTLRRLGLRHLSELDWERVKAEAERMRAKLVPGVLNDLGDDVTRLVQAGVSERQAALLAGLAARWRSGVDVWAEFRPSTAARYRASLRAVGIDIRHPARDLRSVVVSFPQRPPTPLGLVSVGPPDWYRHAA